MKKWLTKDVISAIFLILFGIWWLWGANQITIRDIDIAIGLAANYTPRLYGIILIALALLQLGMAAVKISKGESAAPQGKPRNHKAAMLLLGGLFLYCFLFRILGFIICTVCFLTATTYFLCDPKNGRKDLRFFLYHFGLSVLITAVLYVAFAIGFKISLPTILLY